MLSKHHPFFDEDSPITLPLIMLFFPARVAMVDDYYRGHVQAQRRMPPHFIEYMVGASLVPRLSLSLLSFLVFLLARIYNYANKICTHNKVRKGEGRLGTRLNRSPVTPFLFLFLVSLDDCHCFVDCHC